jgi:hypothetical protein
MAHVTERELISPDGKNKVELFRRANGTYGFRVWYWSDLPSEQCWLMVAGFSESIVADLAMAEDEARGRIDWLGKMPRDA